MIDINTGSEKTQVLNTENSNFKKTNNFMVQFSLDDKDKENEDEFNLKSLARVYKEAYDELFL